MIHGFTRRRALGLFGAGALAGFAAPAWGADARRIAPPSGKMLFRHITHQPLGGGAEIIATRDYEIAFTPLEQGYRVEGGQVASGIEAPPELAALSEIWLTMVNTGMFPFSIDAEGVIVPGSGPEPAPIPRFDEMIDASLDMLRRGGSSEEEIADANAFLRWLDQAAAQISTNVPPNLLVPPASAQRDSRTIELPGGIVGMIEVSFAGTISPETGLMQSARRDVTTLVEGTANKTADSWSLAAI